MGKSQGNGDKRHSQGHGERHLYNHLESKREKREKLMNEAEQKIADLQHRVEVGRKAATAAIALLRPYSVQPKPNMPLRRVIDYSVNTRKPEPRR